MYCRIIEEYSKKIVKTFRFIIFAQTYRLAETSGGITLQLYIFQWEDQGTISPLKLIHAPDAENPWRICETISMEKPSTICPCKGLFP